MLLLNAQRGRITLTMTCLRLGRDLCVTLAGGDRPHIGAVALARSEAGGSSVLTLPGHRESDLAQAIASRLADQFDAAVSVACGIHLDDILPEELAAVLELSQELTSELMARLEEG